MKKLSLFLPLLLTFFILTEAGDQFCSAYCRQKKCSDQTANGCTQCQYPFFQNGSTCSVDTNTGYQLIGTDDSGQITVNMSKSGSCDYFVFYGNLSQGDSMTINNTLGFSSGFYEVRLIFWCIMMDQWNGADKLIATLYGNGVQIQTQTQYRSSDESQEKFCGNNGKKQHYVKYDKTFTYNITDVPLQFIVRTQDDNGNNQASQLWGAKEFILLARECHVACTDCWGGNSNQCSACDYSAYKLSGTTCNASCLSGYGDSFSQEICVLCDNVCEVCFQLSYNCSACTTSGSNEAYLLAYNFSCETDCPEGYFENYTTQICDLCDPSCISCHNTAVNCYECDKSSGYAWNSYTCYNPCPTGTFIDNNNTNCTNCSPYCLQCSGADDYCSVCVLSGTYESYLLNNTCYNNCPSEYYEQTNNNTVNQCLPCDITCYQCTGYPTPCTQCNPTYYLFQSGCVTDCPTQYFTDQVTWTCLLCSQWCVKLTIDMYFPNTLSQKVYVDMNFTEDLNFSSFPYQTFQNFSFDSDLYTIDMFNIQYLITSTSSYRVILQPKGYMFLYNITITCTTMAQPSSGVHQAQNGRPFQTVNYELSANVLWFLIKAPDLTDTQKQIIEGLSEVSDALSNYTTLPYVQELKKMGIFSFLFAGAQITSCSALVNSIPSQNLYQGVRFWAIFVFFDVPKWQQNSDKTKFVVVPPVSDVVQDARMLTERSLFDIHSVEWRFQRTGHTSFFIFDSYAQIFMIVLCWVLVLIGYCVNKHKPLLFKKHMGKFYSFLHKVHEICILYLMITTLLEWIYFDSSSVERWLSLSFSILFNLYFLAYELYIYYDMIKYPSAVIGSQKYEFYAIRYGSLLKNIRYEEYDLKQKWSPKQWFRPYNYHILSYYKKLMMMVCLPLFYNFTHVQILILIILQVLEMIRFCISWPFLKVWRNIYRLILQCALLMFFITVLIQGFLIQQIMKNNESTLETTITLFYRFGWVGFGMVFFFNFGFIALMIFDIYRGCKMTNRQMMDQARRQYYYGKLKDYEEQNEDVPIGLVNKWVKLGNLNQRDYDELPDINLRVEYFRIAQNSNKSYEIEMKKLIQFYMNIQFNFQKENNVNVGKKLNKRFTLTRQLSKSFYLLVDALFRSYSSQNVENIIIKTFQKVQQSLFRPGDRIDLKPEQMTQKIEIQYFSGQKKVQELPKLLQGFPVPLQDLSFLN